jgi:16S rRNA pseudouridine516 synthase
LPADLHGRVADLGAGYGYLATQVIARCPKVSAIDLYEAEARALEPAQINLDNARNSSGRAVEASVHWHDVTRGLPQKYDAIVSNPPFHQGRADLPALGQAFIVSAADALLPDGCLWLVANRHLPYEAIADEAFPRGACGGDAGWFQSDRSSRSAWMKLVKLIANLGYGSRKDVSQMFRAGRITDLEGEVLYADDVVAHETIRIDDEPIDPPVGLVLMMNKPLGVTCSRKDPGRVVYDLLPPRYSVRTPALSSVGRLDRDTSGLLLFTDDGALLHRIISPKAQVAKVYEATLAQDLRGDEGELFASGTLMLESEKEPLAPAVLEVLAPRHARLTVTEGRYHQARRMFAAAGNHVETLRRISVGGLTLGELPLGEWRAMDAGEVARIFDTD